MNCVEDGEESSVAKRYLSGVRVKFFACWKGDIYLEITEDNELLCIRTHGAWADFTSKE